MKKTILTLLLLCCFPFLSFSQEAKYQLSSHILDISTGKPAPGITIQLSKLNENKKWIVIEEKKTDTNGRVKDFLAQKGDEARTGIYKLTFYTEPYYVQQKIESFYPFVEVVFEIKDNAHYHVPITLSPYGYSTYRGN